MDGNRRVATWMAALLACMAAVTAHAASPKAGEVPPDLLGKTPKGEEIRISDHRGKVMVVSFWASWCPQCRRKFPVLDYLQEQVDPEQLRVVVVNFKEDASTYRAVRRQARKSKVTWTHDRNGAVSDAYGVNAVPHTFIIDKTGKVAKVHLGYSERSVPGLIATLNELLAAPAAGDVAALDASSATGSAGP
ncbi:TlpA family protein disulfide reductase [Marilutibacter alkalisoli]|nr:TlpA disulfide reductase family protein [Lysobacter alkalisoli]